MSVANPFALLASDEEGAAEAPAPAPAKKAGAKAAPATLPASIERDSRGKDNRSHRKEGGGNPKSRAGPNDRKSKDPKRSIKGEDKKHGAGAGNWGGPEDAIKDGAAEAKEGSVPALDVEGAGDEAAAEAAEPEVATIGIDEYFAQMKGPKSDAKGPTRKANEGADAKLQSGSMLQKASLEDEAANNKKGRSKNQRSKQKQVLDISFSAPPRSNFDEDRGGRGRGRGRGGEGRGRGRGEGRGRGRGEGRGRGRGEGRGRGRGEGRGRGRGEGRGRGGGRGGGSAPAVVNDMDFPAL